MASSWCETNVQCSHYGHSFYEVTIKSLDTFADSSYTFYRELFESMSCQCCCWSSGEFLFHLLFFLLCFVVKNLKQISNDLVEYGGLYQ